MATINLLTKDFLDVLFYPEPEVDPIQFSSSSGSSVSYQLKDGFPPEWYDGELSKNTTDKNFTLVVTLNNQTSLIAIGAGDVITISGGSGGSGGGTIIFSTPDPDPYYIQKPIIGWNAAAISIEGFPGDGEVTFSVPDTTKGAVAGLNEPYGKSSAGYLGINHAFICRDGKYGISEDGAILPWQVSFVSADTFKIKRTDGFVRYYVNDILIHESTSSTVAPLHLDVSLYASGDAVVDAVLSDLSDSVYAGASVMASSSGLEQNGVYGTGNDVFAPLSTMASSSLIDLVVTQNYFQNTMASISGLSLVEPVTELNGGIASAQMLPAASTASDRPYTAAQGVMEEMEGDGGYQGVIVDVAIASASMYPVISVAGGEEGSNSLNTTQSMEPMEGVAADYAYASGVAEMDPAYSKAGASIELIDGNGIIQDGEGNQGNGILLESGKHMLTAAHVVDQETNYYNFYIVFESVAGYFLAPPVVDVKIHSQWGGDSEILRGYDIAVIEFAYEVDPHVKRHEIYTERDEVGQTFSKRSYSPRVDPETGVVTAAGWDDISNRYDSTTDRLNDVYGGVIPVGNQLLYDFDNGTTINDALGDLYGINNTGVTGEGFTSSGDSGSGSLIDGKVAGITSWHVSLGAPPDYLAETNATYGEVSSETRVSEFADWIMAFGADNTAQAEIGLPTTSIESEATAGVLNEANLDGGLTTVVDAYTGAQAEDDGPNFSLTASGTNLVIGRATIRFPATVIDAHAINGQTAQGDLKMSLTKAITAYTGAQAANLDGFSPSIVAGVNQGSIMSATLRTPLIAIESTVSAVPTGIVSIRPPLIDSLWGCAELAGPTTTITAKGGFDCEVL